MKARVKPKDAPKGAAKPRRPRPAVYVIGRTTLHPVARLHLSAPVTREQVRQAVDGGALLPALYGRAEPCVDDAQLLRWLKTLRGGQ